MIGQSGPGDRENVPSRVQRVRALLVRAASLFTRTRQEHDFDDELASHLALHIDDNRRAGMSPDEARRRALIALGGLEQTKERTRDRRGLPLFDALRQDVRDALRTLRASPGFAVVTVFTLAIGIGASTAIFSLLNAVMLRALPYGDPHTLAYIHTPNRQLSEIPIDALGPPAADFYDWQRQARSFSSLALFEEASFNAAPDPPAAAAATAHAEASSASAGPARPVSAARVSADFFTTVAVPPALGRAINAQDDRPGQGRVAVISHALWQTAFGGDAQVLGRTLRLDGRPYAIVGVMPPAFRYPRQTDFPYVDARAMDVWVPLALSAAARADRGLASHTAIGRLRPGVTVAQAQAEMTTVMARLDPLHPADWRGWSAYVRSAADTAVGDARPLLGLLLGAVSLVLLIACSNTAHLLLARAASRAHDLGVRAALGASRARLARQTLTEALVLAGAGGLLGALLAVGAVRGLRVLDPGNIPRLDESSLDARVLLFCLVISLLTGVLFGLFPALVMSRTDAAALLRRGSSHRATAASTTRMRRGLIVWQIALASVLLAGAGLLIRSYLTLQRVDPGFSSSTLTTRIVLDARYNERTQRRDLWHALLARIRSEPGVQDAALVDVLPFSRSERVGLFEVEGYANKPKQLVDWRAATPGYFEAMGTPLVDGRLFADTDTPDGARVLVVNQAFVSLYLQGRTPIGRRIRFPSVDGSTSESPWVTVVGVVADVRHSTLDAPPRPQVYDLLWQADTFRPYLTIRTARDPADITAVVRAAMQRLDPMLATAEVRPMSALVAETNAKRRFQMLLLGVFAGVALLLAAVGLYGLMAYAVRERASEIGIRLALGAHPAQVMRLVISQGLGLTLLGLTLGIAAALALTRLLRASLYAITPHDPLVFASAALLLALAALLACLVPAAWAARTDPLRVLRQG